MTSSPLHTLEVLPYTRLNHVFALVYISAIIALVYHHVLALLQATTLTSFFLRLSLFLSDAILSFMWIAKQASRVRPIRRKVYPENLPTVLDYSDYPALDVFICTANPYKEPPLTVVNTALSVMAYDYPTDKISVYVSDDGGSILTLFAFMEAAKFALHWLPFCREKNIVDRSPEAYFSSSHDDNLCSPTKKMKVMYEDMKVKVETVIEKGSVEVAHLTHEDELQAFKKWDSEFTDLDHPTIIQVLLESGKDKDTKGHGMPNLVYVSREKNKATPHHFKAGALNVLVRVSAAMSNAPLILTLDCDTYSNDPKTPLLALCYLLDSTKTRTNLAYVQFPQRYHGIDKNDIYGSQIKRISGSSVVGMDGLVGPNYFGTGCFFNRKALFGGPLSQISAEYTQLNPGHVVDKPIQDETVLAMAHHVASCNYENTINWGSEIGFRYGSLVEDYYTGYHILCQGWNSVLCDPDRAAFLGEVPITLNDVLCQERRWALGLLEVAFCKYSPLTFGSKSLGLIMGMAECEYAFFPIWSIPITIYAFLPPLALSSQTHIFPKVSSPWFFLYMFLFLGAYVQDCLDYIFTSRGGTFQQWYNDQRMWMMRGVSSKLFGLMDFLLQTLGMSSFGFTVTSKVVDEEEKRRYEQGLFEFGVASPLFVPPTTIAIVHLIAFVLGITEIFRHGNWDEAFVQLMITGFVLVNSWPIYEAMIIRVDRGRMPPLITLESICLALVLILVSWL